MKSWLIQSIVVLVVFLALGTNGQSSGTNVPDNPLWPLFAELLSTQTGRTVEDINTLGLNDPTINQMWAIYQASMPKLDTSPTQQSPAPPQPSYTISSNPSSGIIPSSPTSGGGYLNNLINPQTTSASTSGTSAPSVQNLLQAYQKIMALGGTGSNQVTTTGQLMAGTPSSTSTSSMAPSYADLQQQYQAIMGQTGTVTPTYSPTSSSSSSSSSSSLDQMMQVYSQILGGQSPSSLTNQMMSTYSNLMGGGQVGGFGTSTSNSGMTSLQSTSPLDQMMQAYNQLMENRLPTTGYGSSTPTLDQLMATYNQFMATGVTGGQSPSVQATSNQPISSVSGGSSVTSSNSGSPQTAPSSGSTSVDGSISNTNALSTPQPQPSPSSLPSSSSTSSSSSLTSSSGTTSTASASFDQQLIELFPQFKSLMGTSSLSSSSSPSSSQISSSTPSPSSSSSSPSSLISSTPAPSNTSSNITESPTPQDISNTNSAQQIFDVLLFGQGPTNTQTPSSPTITNNNNNNPQKQQKSPLEQYVDMQQQKNPGKLLSAHMENVWKTRASRDIGCRFLPELLELDIVPTMPLDCRNKCPFPYVNPQRFGVFCVCCPPGVNDKLVSTLSFLRRPSFINDNPLKVVS